MFNVYLLWPQFRGMSMKKKMKPNVKNGRNHWRHHVSAVTDAYLEHGSYLKAFLCRFFHRPQDIEDVAQEAYIKAFQAEQKESVEHPKTLLFTIAKNIALNELRNKTRRITDYIEECHVIPVKETPTIDQELEGLNKLELYCKAVDSLPEQCRRVYLLRKVHGLSQQEIAKQLGVTQRTVERHLQKGVLECKRYLDEHEEGGAVKQKNQHQTFVQYKEGKKYE